MKIEQLEKSIELNKKIEEYSKQIDLISSARRMKKSKDRDARDKIEKGGAYNYHHEEWTLSKFFSILFEKRKIYLAPHYEFASEIELDAEPELIDLILDYLEKKKANLEKELEQI